MKNIEWYWNVIHFSIFSLLICSQRIFNYPLVKLLEIKSIKNFYARRGVKNPAGMVNDVTTNDEYSINILGANIQMGGILVMLEYSIFNIFQAVSGLNLLAIISEQKLSLILFAVLLIFPPGFFNYYTLFKNEKYLNYFAEIRQLAPLQVRKLHLFSLCFIVLTIGILSGSFILLQGVLY